MNCSLPFEQETSTHTLRVAGLVARWGSWAVSVILPLSLALFFPKPAQAHKPSGTTQKRLSRARKLFTRAKKLCVERRFKSCIITYEKALRWVKRAGGYPKKEALIQFNMAQAHRQLGEHREAIPLYEAYLDKRPDAPNRAAVRGYLREMRSRVRAEQRDAEHKPAPSEKKGGTGKRTKTRNHSHWLWIAAGAGVVVAGAEAGAWGLWSRYEGGKQTSNKSYGYAYYSLHGVAAASAALAVTALVFYLKSPGEETNEKSQAMERRRKVGVKSGEVEWAPVLTPGRKSVFLGVVGRWD